MSSLAFRDSSIVLIETGRTSVKAGIGLYDLLKIPSVEIQARVAVRPETRLLSQDPSASTSRAQSVLPQFHPSPSAKVTDYLVGAQLDEALAAGQDLVVSWPFADGQINDWVQAEALWCASSSNRCSTI